MTLTLLLRLAVARAVRKPAPDANTSAHACPEAGAAQQAVETTALGVGAFEDYAPIAGTQSSSPTRRPPRADSPANSSGTPPTTASRE